MGKSKATAWKACPRARATQILSGLLAASTLVLPGVAWGDDATAAAERGHFGLAQSGRPRGVAASPSPAWVRAYGQGHWSIAAELIETVPEASRTPSQWLHLGRAREKLGQLVEAFDAYQQLRDLGSQGKRGSGAKDVQRQAEAEANALERRIPWAEVDLGGEVPPDALVFVDERWLPPARLVSPYPVDPGWHTILLEWQGQVQAAERVHFEEGQSRQVVLQRWRTGGASQSAAAVASDPVMRAAREARKLSWQPAAREPEDGGHSDLRTASYVSLGVGALGLAVGTVSAIVAVAQRGQLDQLAEDCGAVCVDPDGSQQARARELSAGMQRATAVASTSFAVAGLGLVTGSVLLLLGRDSLPAANVAGVEVQPLLGAREAGLTGTF